MMISYFQGHIHRGLSYPQGCKMQAYGGQAAASSVWKVVCAVQVVAARTVQVCAVQVPASEEQQEYVLDQMAVVQAMEGQE